ncbi:MAG: selenite/tellurite reduction operon b-type cytochrome iron-sulfur cluster-binding subunit ExtO [Thermodesulfobacteriota bacterium]
MRWMMLCIAACFLAVSATDGTAGENCTICHPVVPKGVHAGLSCTACHGTEAKAIGNPASAVSRAAGCVGCHKGYDALFDQPMGTRSRERRFVDRTVGRNDPAFFQKNCSGCHLRGCTDCHGGKGHALSKASDRSCLACHKGYFVGRDYFGMAPREESLRYQRGLRVDGETYLKMTPDVHAEAGMACSACHSMKSLVAGATSAKRCVDCHEVRQTVIEHQIAAHREKLECFACHSAWAPQEYGTFYLRFTDSPSQKEFRVAKNSGDYVKSAYLKKQDAPPLGINARGKVSPIRPQFILFFTDIRNERVVGAENRLMAAEWKAYFPHTVRRGAPLCDGCHDNPRRFLLEAEANRIYRLQADGMTLASFWQRSGQTVANGGFLPASRHLRMVKKGPAYQKAYVKRWKSLIDRVEN